MGFSPGLLDTKPRPNSRLVKPVGLVAVVHECQKHGV